MSKYPDYKDYSFNCVGSVGFVFKDILEEVAVSYDMHVGKVIQSPMEGLVDYHINLKIEFLLFPQSLVLFHLERDVFDLY